MKNKETIMKNKLPDLNNHLFEQLERLNDDDLTPAQIEHEGARALAMVKVSDQIIKGADLQLKAAQVLAQGGLEGGLIREKFKMIDPPREFKTVENLSAPSAAPAEDVSPEDSTIIPVKQPYAWRDKAS